MKKLLPALLIAIFALSGVAFAQYVSTVLQNTITAAQQRIAEDKANIHTLFQDINAQEQVINGIMNDASADAVTSDVPAITAIQAAKTATPVSGKTNTTAVVDNSASN